MTSLIPHAENQGSVAFTPGKLGHNQFTGRVSLGDNSTDRVRFYFNENRKKVNENGEAKPMIYCSIQTLNDNKSAVDRPVRDIDKVRYPIQWQMFVSGGEQQLGTPIEDWLNKGIIVEQDYHNLKAANFHTVEGIASANPAFLEGFGAAGSRLQKLAVEHTEAAKEQELEEQKQAMKAELKAEFMQELREAGVIPAPKAKRRTTQKVKEEIASENDKENN